MQIKKEINFQQIEKKWQKKWEEKKAFEVKEDKKKNKSYVLEMFPYPSGSGLHMGHAFNYTIGDIYARFKRMQGLNVLYSMGYDSFGLPAENAAIKEGVNPKKYTEKAISNFITQQKSLGLSYDWQRMFKTSDPDYYKWNQYLFLQFYKKGLVYRKKSAVNWCSKCNTVLANEQVQDGKCWRHNDTKVEIKNLEQWFIKTTKYAEELLNELEKLDWPERIKIMQRNWIGKSEGSEVLFDIPYSKETNFVLLHGYTGSPEANFFPWLKKELENKGYKVSVPKLPDTNNPNIIEQIDYVLKNCRFDENTVLLGHSLGSVIALKVLENLKKPIKKLILAAGFVVPNNSDRPYVKTFNWKFDFDKIKNNTGDIHILKDLKDKVVREPAAAKVKEAIGGAIVEFEAQDEHICGKEEPEVLKACLQKWPVFTTRPDTLFGVTFLVVSAQHPRLSELITKEQKSQVEKFLKKISSTKQEDMDKLEKDGVFTGSYAIHPLTNEKIQIWAGNFVVADYGSGMVMAVPAHDQRDFEFAKKYNLPIKPVILKNHEESFSYVMGINEKEIKNIGVKIIEKTKDGFFKIKIPFNKLDNYKDFIRKNLKSGFWNEFSTKKGFYFIFKHKSGKIEELELNEKTNDIIDKYGMTFNNEKPKEKPENVYSWLAKNDFYKELLIHQDAGKLINSQAFNDLFSEEAKEHITKALEFKKLGNKKIQYKLRDWLVSRQRYWGTPIPIIYCNDCGIVSVEEKDLPVVLPEKVKFGKGNPLETNKDFVEVKCPKCRKKARRETDTMDTFFDSSWYYLRFTDANNSKKPFEKEKVDYWMPLNQYIGGAEHAVMHLIYARFFSKALRDMNFVSYSEPFPRLFNQGMLHGEDGFVMSKSRGNVIDPMDTISKYGADPLRFFLISMGSPDKDSVWSSSGIEGSYKFLKKVFELLSKIKIGKTSPKAAHKLNKTIKSITEEIEDLKYNSSAIKLRLLFDSLENEISKNDLHSIIKLLAPICPHIAEELWENTGNKSLVSLEKWPQIDESKINPEFDKIEKSNEQAITDIQNIIKILKEKQNKNVEKIYIYVIPNELNYYSEKEISERINKKVKIFVVNDKNKYDPENKAQKARPGKPAIYLE